MNTRPKVSVVIPVYNGAATVAEAIQSVLDQTLTGIEVIVVDDGSTDETSSVLAEFGDGITVVAGAHSGHAAAREAGHRSAAGEYIGWLDADDVARKDRFEIQAAVLDANPGVVLVSSDFEAFTDGDSVGGGGIEEYYGLSGDRALAALYGSSRALPEPHADHRVLMADVSFEIVFGNFVHPPTVMMRSEVYEAGRPAPAGLPIAEDWLCFVELAASGLFAIVDAPLVRYRLSDSQMSSATRRAKLAADVLAASELVMDRHPARAGQDPSRCSAFLASGHLAVAEAVADRHGAKALRHLWNSARLAGPTVPHLKVFAKALLPHRILGGVRELRAAATKS